MIVYCGECGYSGQSGDAFCGSCGTLLERREERAGALTGSVARRLPPSRRLNPGDLVCGRCGEGSAPTRRFCRRCGAPLAGASVARIPWWERLRARIRRLPPGPTRPPEAAP